MTTSRSATTRLSSSGCCQHLQLDDLQLAANLSVPCSDRCRGCVAAASCSKVRLSPASFWPNDVCCSWPAPSQRCKGSNARPTKPTCNKSVILTTITFGPAGPGIWSTSNRIMDPGDSMTTQTGERLSPGRSLASERADRLHDEVEAERLAADLRYVSESIRHVSNVLASVFLSRMHGQGDAGGAGT